VILDGGLATELERRGADLDDPLWSARVLLEEPEAIEAVHAAYYAAGARCATSASYQASYAGFAARGLGEAETTRLLRLSVALADGARRRFGGRDLLVAASVGPYGAVLHDRSEYRGDYGLDVGDLTAWHRQRFAVLADAGADLLACETIPTMVEAEALVRLMGEHPDVRAWVSFTCRDGQHTAAGEPLMEAAAMLDRVPQVVAVGVNCVPAGMVSDCVGSLRAGTHKPIVVYPAGGEDFAARAPAWVAAGASWLGGCCGTAPVDIAALARVVGGE
jgi:homocysteine S-methyltransferase